MESRQILAEIESEIQRLEQVKALLTGNSFNGSAGKPAARSAAPRKRNFSVAARARMAAAQKARWAKSRNTDK
jgi:hypothetical protein